MKNFRYYLALALMLMLSLAVRVHAATPAAKAVAQAQRAHHIAQHLGSRTQLLLQQTHHSALR
ncbi:hypothetical protein D3Y59_09830 [Hymenobacter oligotrophus]|uniref:Uncharacterized protein n=1 Tax=Hymenobacter oligotrophus TaxID=2319843 RepID=A0A3B7R079_9BACT|nr:hypothetical protein [Hymenobacter oligotrophus]AYA37325.1 hypothetical protein D3Y59_09830 [Hymenobacter oligotrophus]